MAQFDFRRHVEKHRPALAPQLVAGKTVEQHSEAEFVELARRLFVERGEMTYTLRLD